MKNKLNTYVILMTAFYVKIVGKFWPSLAGRAVNLFWFNVQKPKPNSARATWIAKSDITPIHHRGQILKAYHRKPAQPSQGQVILVHGWSGRWDQLLSIAEELHDKNFEVITFDLPSHGENKGQESDFPEQSEFLKSVYDTLNLNSPIVVCHSAGFLTLSHAILARELQISKLVTINSPARFEFLFELFCKQLNLPPSFDAELWKVIERRLNKKDVRSQFSTLHMSQLNQKDILNIHDQNDKEVHYSEFEQMNRLWPNSKKLSTVNLGHNRILKDQRTVQAISDFLSF
jgi:pimeloyl-ACP methyl ester carboxylesterase